VFDQVMSTIIDALLAVPPIRFVMGLVESRWRPLWAALWTRARFVAFAMDSSGAIIARDSARVASAVTGMFVEFRFRHVDCDEIADWQIEATTPK